MKQVSEQDYEQFRALERETLQLRLALDHACKWLGTVLNKPHLQKDATRANPDPRVGLMHLIGALRQPGITAAAARAAAAEAVCHAALELGVVLEKQIASVIQGFEQPSGEAAEVDRATQRFHIELAKWRTLAGPQAGELTKKPKEIGGGPN
jgi:hypothetical protein